MILTELAELAKRNDFPPVGCWEREVAATLNIDLQGKFQGCIFHKQVKDSKLPRLWFPFIQPTNSGKPSIGVHKLEHLLGRKFRAVGTKKTKKIAFSPNDGCKIKRDLLCDFAKWCCLHKTCNEDIDAWYKFLHDDSEAENFCQQLERKVEDHALNSSDYVAIRVDDRSWWQNDEVVKLWQSAARDISDAVPDLKKGKRRGLLVMGAPRSQIAESISGQCLVCGECAALERLVPSFDALTRSKVGDKVVPDKLKFTSFNRASYSSRGLHKSYNAPICKGCADRAAKAWNKLVRNPNSRFLLDDQVVVFWGEIIVKSWEVKEKDAKVWKELLKSPIKGIAERIGPQGICVLGLGSHESSAFVTIWLKRDAQRTAASILRWVSWQTIHRSNEPQYFSLTELVTSLRPRKERDKWRQGGRRLLDKHEARLWRDLLYLSYGEGKVPPYVLNRLVERLSIELEPYPLDRLILLNICLCSLNDLEEIDVNKLTDRQRNAFNAGRIFNLVCYAQRVAIGDTGKTLLASNARLAASRPAQILGELITRLHQVYYPKLRRDKTGLYVWLDTLISGLVSETSLQTKHSPEEMGWFWKGFYGSDLSEEYKRYQAMRKQGDTK